MQKEFQCKLTNKVVSYRNKISIVLSGRNERADMKRAAAVLRRGLDTHLSHCVLVDEVKNNIGVYRVFAALKSSYFAYLCDFFIRA